MLSVRFVLIPLGEHAPYIVPTIPEEGILSEAGPTQIPGNGELSVASFPIPVDSGRYYQVEFNMDAPDGNAQLFYIDFYGGPNYDFEDQNKALKIKKGTHSYSAIIYAGDKPINSVDTSIRIVSISNESLEISKLRVIKLVPPAENPDYIPVAKTDHYTIYENSRAQKLLYIPRRVRSVENAAKLRKNPNKHGGLDRVSYVEGIKDKETSGTLEILSVKNNSLTARVSSEEGTFVNHSQSFYPGWKAYIDGQPVPIHLVNGVIQGVEVPPGDHIVKFVYSPMSLKIGALISLVALCIAAGYIIFENGRNKSPVADQEG